MNTTILLLEPDHDLNRLFTCLLQSEGYRVHTLHRWQDAQIILSVRIPDLIIFDWVSTARGGYQWIRQVRMEPATAHIPLLVLCCDALPTDRRAWDALAGSTVIESPIDLERFRQQVHALAVWPHRSWECSPVGIHPRTSGSRRHPTCITLGII